jgi:predicted regulator of Ras-like GTPase activity (Roadblock/LC7/MglB family)
MSRLLSAASETEVDTMPDAASRSTRLDHALSDLLTQAPEVEAAAVVSFDGLPMASALPASMDEDRVAAMSAALLSLGERAAEGLGRGALNQVYIEGEHGTVFLVSADDEAVLVAVAGKGAKVGMMLYEVRRTAAAVADALRVQTPPAADSSAPAQAPVQYAEQPAQYAEPAATATAQYAEPVAAATAQYAEAYAPVSSDPSWPTYLPNGTGTTPEPSSWA